MAFSRAWLDASKSVALVLCVGACVALSCASGNESTLATQTSADVGAGAGVAAVGPSSSSTATSTGVGGASGSSTSVGGGGQSSVGASSGGASNASTGVGGTGNGGAGGAPASSSSTGAGGQGGGTIVLLAGPAVFAAEFHPAVGWTGAGLAGTTDVGPAIAMTGAKSAVGLIRSSPNAGDLRFTTWTPGAFASFASVSAGITTTPGTPAIVGAGTQALAAFIGMDDKYYYAAYVTQWSPTAEPVGAPQSFGPSAPSITAIGDTAIVAYRGNDNDLYDQSRAGGIWQTGHAHGLIATVGPSPTIIAPTLGPDLMIVYAQVDSKILFTTRTGGIWSPPAPIDPTALSADPIAVAALPNGFAVAAYRGTDSMVYTSRYTPNGAPAWSVPAAIASPNFSTPSSPSVAPGVGGTDAELVFADGVAGSVKHSRLTGAVWTAPVSIDGSANLTHVAIASAP